MQTRKMPVGDHEANNYPEGSRNLQIKDLQTFTHFVYLCRL